MAMNLSATRLRSLAILPAASVSRRVRLCPRRLTASAVWSRTVCLSSSRRRLRVAAAGARCWLGVGGGRGAGQGGSPSSSRPPPCPKTSSSLSCPCSAPAAGPRRGAASMSAAAAALGVESMSAVPVPVLLRGIPGSTPIQRPSCASYVATMRALSRGRGFPRPSCWRSGCHPLSTRLIACSPARVGGPQRLPSFRVLRFPHAPQWVHSTMGRSASTLARTCPWSVKEVAESAIPRPLHRWWRRYCGIEAAVI